MVMLRVNVEGGGRWTGRSKMGVVVEVVEEVEEEEEEGSDDVGLDLFLDDEEEDEEEEVCLECRRFLCCLFFCSFRSLTYSGTMIA